MPQGVKGRNGSLLSEKEGVVAKAFSAFATSRKIMVKDARRFRDGKEIQPEHDLVEWKSWMSVAAPVLILLLAVLLALFFVIHFAS